MQDLCLQKSDLSPTAWIKFKLNLPNGLKNYLGQVHEFNSVLMLVERNVMHYYCMFIFHFVSRKY